MLTIVPLAVNSKSLIPNFRGDKIYWRTLLLVLPNNTIGGAERVMLNLAPHAHRVKKFKTEIVVLTGSDTGSTWLNTFANVKIPWLCEKFYFLRLRHILRV